MTALTFGDARVRNWPRTPLQLLKEWYHVTMALYWAVRLMFKRSDTKPTYRYCWHLDQISYFRTRFQAWLAADRVRVSYWMEPRLFIDYMPDEERLKSCPGGTVGGAYCAMCERHRREGLLDLRERRLEVNPEEAKGLDLNRLRSVNDPNDLFERIRARRNIFMTSTHDFCHMITGSSTGVSGEALVARYQYNNLLVPQNWLNMVLALVVHAATLDLAEIERIRTRFPAIDAANDYWSLDFEKIWDRPVGDVRALLSLPPEGFMPDDDFPEARGSSIAETARGA